MVSIPKMLVIIPILLVSRILVLVHLTIICSLTLLFIAGSGRLKKLSENYHSTAIMQLAALGENITTA